MCPREEHNVVDESQVIAESEQEATPAEGETTPGEGAETVEEETPTEGEATPEEETPAEGEGEEAVPGEKKPAPKTARGKPVGGEAAGGGFKPNYGFKVMDKNYDLTKLPAEVAKEVPEFLKDLIKDDKSQKEVMDVVTRLIGFNESKRQYPKLVQENSGLKDYTKRIESGYQRLEGLAIKGDPESLHEFSKFWKIPEENVLKYAAHLLRLREMAPEDRAAHERAFENRVRAGQLESQVQQSEGRTISAEGQLRMMQLEREISRPDVADVVSAYDQRAGQSGAFTARVIRTAQFYALKEKRDLSPAEAIQEVMRELGYEETDDVPAQPAQGGAPARTQAGKPAARTVAPVAQKKLPVLPNTGSGGLSPVKKVVGSLSDLRARAKAARQPETD